MDLTSLPSRRRLPLAQAVEKVLQPEKGVHSAGIEIRTRPPVPLPPGPLGLREILLVIAQLYELANGHAAVHLSLLDEMLGSVALLLVLPGLFPAVGILHGCCADGIETSSPNGTPKHGFPSFSRLFEPKKKKPPLFLRRLRLSF